MAKKPTPAPAAAPPVPWPADKVERRPIIGLVPYANNARMHSPEQVAQIAAALREFGWTNPVLVDEDGEIIAGHGRVLAAESLGLVEVPVMVATGWTREQKRAYAIADNQLPANAHWNPGLLVLEVGELKLAGYDLGLLAFPAEQLQQLEAGSFAPNLNPGLAGGFNVTGEDVRTTQQRLDGQFAAAGQQSIVDVVCPHCGQKFGVNREDLK